MFFLVYYYFSLSSSCHTVTQLNMAVWAMCTLACFLSFTTTSPCRVIIGNYFSVLQVSWTPNTKVSIQQRLIYSEIPKDRSLAQSRCTSTKPVRGRTHIHTYTQCQWECQSNSGGSSNGSGSSSGSGSNSGNSTGSSRAAAVTAAQQQQQQQQQWHHSSSSAVATAMAAFYWFHLVSISGSSHLVVCILFVTL